MRNKPSLVGLSILAGGLSFVGTARAIDLIIDGSYESSTNNLSGVIGQGGTDGPGMDGGWSIFSTYTYSAGYTQTGPAGSGQVYLRPYPPSGGTPGSSTTVSQTNSLTRAITTAQIDGSQGQYTVSAWFSTYHGQNDYSILTLQFLDDSFAPVSSPVTLGGLAFVSALAGGGGDRAWGQDTKGGLVPPGSRYAAVTTASTALAGSPDGYVDLVALDVVAGFVPIQLNTPTPANATGVSPGAVLGVTLQDGTAPLNNSSVQFFYDNSSVVPSIIKNGVSSRVEYDPPGILASLSTHTFKVAYNNTGGAVPNTTNEYTFTVAPWVNINLGSPIHLETFDSVAEGALPAGWTVQNFTDEVTDGLDLNDVTSDSYLDWVVISRSRLINNIMATNVIDFAPTTNVAPNQVINGALVTNLISSNYIWAVSARINNTKQIQYLFTRDYNLSGQTNVYLSFHNIYEQNQDSLGSVEYSINGGTTWLPALYMLDGPDISVDSLGNIDASNTLATVHGDVPDIDASTLGNGFYGRYIGVASNQWAGLAPYISPRLDDNGTSSKRVEIIRLTQADNQAAVRFRFAQVGTWSWYFGIDNFGLYSISTASAPLVGVPVPATQTVAMGNSASFSIDEPTGLGPFSYQWRHYGTNLAGKTSQGLVVPVVHLSDAGPYDVVVSSPGGAVTSSAPAAVLTVINPAVYVTGQWNFNNGDLTTIYGANLEYYDSSVQSDTTFGTTTSFGIPDIAGQAVNVMHLNPTVSAWGGYKMFHGALPNGGGSYVNQYTLIYDIYIPSDAWRSLLQTDIGNSNDGDVFIDDLGRIGISGVYQGDVSVGEWHRIAFAVDLAGPGQAPVLTKFIDGVKVGNQIDGLSAVDGRFALESHALLFGDEAGGDINETFVSSIQFSNGRRSDEYLKKITQGGATPYKIPGAIRALRNGSTVLIHWTGFAGGTGLESADSLNGPWSPVVTATNPYTAPAGPTPKYYRPAIHFP